MAWRALLSDRPIRRVDLLPCKPAALAVWTHANRVTLLDLQHGAKIEERLLDEPGGTSFLSPPWRAYLASLTVPGDATLPYARASQVSVYSAQTGSTYLFVAPNQTMTFERGGQLYPLVVESGSAILAQAVSGDGRTIAMLDRKGRLHLYREQVRTGIFEVGLHPLDELAPALAITDSGSLVFAGDGQRLSVVDEAGRVVRRTETPYPVGTFACSGDGKWLVTTDLESGVLRAYSGADLTVSHQRFATDLLADSRRAQVLPVTISAAAAVGPLAVNNRGIIAFGTSSGLVCATSLTRMKVIPRAKKG